MKFLVEQDCDYVRGHLRYGHIEGEIEVYSQEELEQMMADGTYQDYCDVIVDEYRVEDWELCGEPKVTPIKEDNAP